MAYLLYSYRLKIEVPLLDEDEWQNVFGTREDTRKNVTRYAKEVSYERDHSKESEQAFITARKQYYKITRVDLSALQLLSVRLSEYGAPCPTCHKLLRTPKARFCMECGHELASGEVAGPALPRDLRGLKIGDVD